MHQYGPRAEICRKRPSAVTPAGYPAVESEVRHMALGPKAMGEAIIASLKVKTGRDLRQWQAELDQVMDRTEARERLMQLGLGRFQAIAVVEHTFAVDPYADERRLVDDHFARFPAQRGLYDEAVRHLLARKLRPQPCRTYLPIYRDGKIAISFKATERGLYAALNLSNSSKWPDRVAHKPSLGGSARLKDGVYLTHASQVKRLLRELEVDT